ncbi:hypothetical protein K437DRAFT_252985 [Tilletiaria anomala UBC 951]|uniref:Uncharacterized protein n=1 Tax=Tilletiaria anomala (strain ATCC 24038 / CBS 436.72 / UBC 951) TaxID=1037660 RepID=A0A066WRI9_TILAU|nr:uncharacterized protein K437DRAFT_252985 [Tilletiaria anomala UBC 951]KDN53619.1 hypothetical protein K437DRAFT_252985 [Tilletiaria anomala UBC 951]
MAASLVLALASHAGPSRLPILHSGQPVLHSALVRASVIHRRLANLSRTGASSSSSSFSSRSHVHSSSPQLPMSKPAPPRPQSPLSSRSHPQSVGSHGPDGGEGGPEGGKGGTKKSIWQSWLALPPRVRMAFGTIFGAGCVGGLFISDKLEECFPAESPSTSPGGRKERKPRLFAVSVVDKDI